MAERNCSLCRTAKFDCVGPIQPIANGPRIWPLDGKRFQHPLLIREALVLDARCAQQLQLAGEQLGLDSGADNRPIIINPSLPS
ncbi:hypothetical protein ACFLZ1_04000 [Patescibacteria group bacterium]